ncbi:hypothetical protein PybrP1_002361 [[Pythium] brassicae (nom. inval.)]|nr:hypothetical protein PybrP1_002361 [[Pythium] brassicae (nom. inval.)]
MSVVVQVPMGGAMLEGFAVGEVLICKANRGKVQELAYLVDSLQADVNYRNQNGASALHGAAASGQLEVVQWLMALPSIKRDVTDHDNQTPLHYAAFYGHLEVVQFLVEHGVPLDVPDKFGRYAHCSAAINGHLDVVTYLLEECPHPIDINAIDEYGGTCLHWAASKGRKEVIQYLCMKGIDVHITSYFLKSWYETSQRFVHAAEYGDDEEVTRIIAEINGAYPLRYLRDKNGKNAMHWAAEAGHLSTLNILCDHFAVWTDSDKFGRNALHCAALGGHRDCAFLLIRKARNPLQFISLTMTNKTPSRCAFEAGHSALASRLQAWEEGTGEYSTNDDDYIPSSDHSSFRSTMDEDEIPLVINPSPTRNMDTVHNWLKSLKMEEYIENFEKDGFDTLRGVATINEDDLIDMGVKKGHRRVVLSHIEELRYHLMALDESAQSAGQEPASSPTLNMLSTVAKAPSNVSLLSSGDASAPRLERRGSLTVMTLDGCRD